MRPNALETVATVRAFLATDLRDAVPPELASELRAAIKLLATAEDELGGMADALREEAGDLLLACTDALRYVEAPEAEAIYTALMQRRPVEMELPELAAFQRAVRDLTAGVVTALQAHCRDSAVAAADRRAAHRLLAHFYELLGAQAARRSPWQSVFAPDDPAPSNAAAPTPVAVEARRHSRGEGRPLRPVATASTTKRGPG